MGLLKSALGCQGWFAAKFATLGELDAALAKASTAKSTCYIKVVAGKLHLRQDLSLPTSVSDAPYVNAVKVMFPRDLDIIRQLR